MHCRRCAGMASADRRRRGACPDDRTGQQAAPETGSQAGTELLPGLVGSGPLWLRGCHQVDAAYACGEWLALQGEPGPASWRCCGQCTGAATRPAAFQVLDAADAGRARLAGRRAANCRNGRGAWSSGTSTSSAPGGCTRCGQPWSRPWPRTGARSLGRRHSQPEPAHRRPGGPAAVLPAHRRAAAAPSPHRGPARTRAVLPGELNQHGPLVCSSEAMQLLLRSSWPGNIEQFWQVIKRCRCTGAAPGPSAPRPAARMLDGEPQAAQPAGVDGTRCDRAEPAGP